MSFISPMLATATDTLPSGSWIAEEKYDGHRIVVGVTDRGSVLAWSRTGKRRELPPHLCRSLSTFPQGTYDGELITARGQHSYDVSNKSNANSLMYMVFDLLSLRGEDCTWRSWAERRARLVQIFARLPDDAVRLSLTTTVRTWRDVEEFVGGIWSVGGEGAILKKVDAPYCVGKRTKVFLKVKSLKSAVLTITGWDAGTTGSYCVALLKDDEGNATAVKVRTDELRARVAANPTSFLGRKLAIEYQERTPDGNYRHPRWDHLFVGE